VLDATAAFQGKKERPFETGFVVPSGKPTREIYKPTVRPIGVEFFTQFINFRPLVWDQYFYKGSILAPDMVGGFYSFREDAPPPPGPLSLPPQGSQDGPPVDFRKAGRQFFVSNRPVRPTRRGLLKIQVVCRSQVRCDGVMRLKSRLRSGRTGRLRTVRLGAKRFTAEARTRTTVTLRIPRSGRRAVSRRRRQRTVLVTKLLADVNAQPALVKRKNLLLFRPR